MENIQAQGPCRWYPFFLFFLAKQNKKGLKRKIFVALFLNCSHQSLLPVLVGLPFSNSLTQHFVYYKTERIHISILKKIWKNFYLSNSNLCMLGHWNIYLPRVVNIDIIIQNLKKKKTQENRYFDLTTFLWTNCATAKLNFLKKSNNAEKYDVHGGLKFKKSAI